MRRPWLSPCSIWILRAASLSGLGFFLKVCSRQKCRARSPCEFDWGFPRGHRALRRGPSPSYRTVQVACLRVSRALSWRPVHLAARPTATGLAAKLAKIVILRRPRYTVHSTDSWTDPAARGGGGAAPTMGNLLWHGAKSSSALSSSNYGRITAGRRGTISSCAFLVLFTCYCPQRSGPASATLVLVVFFYSGYTLVLCVRL